ncbi:MAG: Gfo/Idh/MocA family oxidoreductase [Pseudohongiellaceae bacterium]
MKQIRLGMIGGGTGSFIGPIHRKAAGLDGRFILHAGAFSSDVNTSQDTGRELHLHPSRVYRSFQEMLQQEAALPVAQRIQAVAIVTPNHLHAEPAIMAMERGIHVILDKPMCVSLAEAQKLKTVADQTGCLLAVTHTYAGYPLVKEARHLVKSGKLGKIRKIYIEYPQGWLSTFLESSGQKQAAWRTDPQRAGKGGSIGDIGTHAAHLAEYVSGLKITHVCAALHTQVSGRLLDDDAAALLRFEQGASGVLIATQVAAGEENNLKIRLYGESGGLEWSHNEANSLQVKMLDQPLQIYRSGSSYLSRVARDNSRLPAGHPEGFIEALANVYNNFANAVDAKIHNSFDPAKDYDFPSVEDGLRSIAFIETMIASANAAEKWTKVVTR